MRFIRGYPVSRPRDLERVAADLCKVDLQVDFWADSAKTGAAVHISAKLRSDALMSSLDLDFTGKNSCTFTEWPRRPGPDIEMTQLEGMLFFLHEMERLCFRDSWFAGKRCKIRPERVAVACRLHLTQVKLKRKYYAEFGFKTR